MNVPCGASVIVNTFLVLTEAVNLLILSKRNKGFSLVKAIVVLSLRAYHVLLDTVAGLDVFCLDVPVSFEAKGVELHQFPLGLGALCVQLHALFVQRNRRIGLKHFNSQFGSIDIVRLSICVNGNLCRLRKLKIISLAGSEFCTFGIRNSDILTPVYRYS